MTVLGAVGFFLSGVPPVAAEAPIKTIRAAVESYAAELPETNPRRFFIDPAVLAVNNGAADRLFVVGLTPNNTTVNIYIDDILVDAVSVAAEPEDRVAVFSYQIKWLLAQETHTVYAQAVDRAGAVSKPSSRMYFSVNDATVPQISATRIEGDGAVEAVAVSSGRPPRPLAGILTPPNGVNAPPVTISRTETALLLIIAALLSSWLWSGRRQER